MPLVKVTSSVVPNDAARSALLADLSRLAASKLGKPEAYVMTAFELVSAMTFGGTTEPSAYVELKNVGRFTPELTASLSAEICERLSKALGVPKARIYIEFTGAEGYLWGHDGETFG